VPCIVSLTLAGASGVHTSLAEEEENGYENQNIQSSIHDAVKYVI